MFRKVSVVLDVNKEAKVERRGSTNCMLGMELGFDIWMLIL